MELKKEFARQDSLVLLLCVCVPPLGYALAWRRHWIGTGAASAGALLYIVAIGGFLLAGYPHTANDMVTLQALWGVLMVIAICGDFLAGRRAALAAKVLLVLLLGLFAASYTPHADLGCLLGCASISWRSLHGKSAVLAPGAGLLVFLLALYGLLGLALWLGISRERK